VITPDPRQKGTKGIRGGKGRRKGEGSFVMVVVGMNAL